MQSLITCSRGKKCAMRFAPFQAANRLKSGRPIAAAMQRATALVSLLALAAWAPLMQPAHPSNLHHPCARPPAHACATPSQVCMLLLASWSAPASAQMCAEDWECAGPDRFCGLPGTGGRRSCQACWRCCLLPQQHGSCAPRLGGRSTGSWKARPAPRCCIAARSRYPSAARGEGAARGGGGACAAQWQACKPTPAPSPGFPHFVGS